MLDETGSPDRATQEIVSDPALIAEARAVLPALKAVAEAKAGERGVRAVIERRFQTYPQPVRSASEWAIWWADYIDVLEDVALASLEAAMRAYVALPDSEFMPKPGKLREMAFTAPSRSLQRYYRAKRALQIADEPIAIAAPRVDPSEVKALMDEFNAIHEAKKVPEAPVRYTGGIPDAGGLTPQMRALMARRAEEAGR